MRLNDFQQRVDEKLENWIGNYGASTVQQMKNRMKGDTEGELSVAEKMGKNKFINDFVARAYATLNSEIQSGRVDPSASSTPKPKTPAEIRAEKQKSAAANAQSQMASPAKPAAPQKVDPQAAEKLKGKLKAGQGLGKKTGAGFKDYVGGSGERMTGVDASRAPVFKKIQRESRYDRLNNIFESLLTEAESVGQFFKRWLPTYMKGVNLSDPHTQSLIQSIEDTYAQDKGKAALTQLANASYAASFAPGFGGQGQPAQQGPQASDAMMKAISTASNAKELAAGIRTAMTRLNALDKTAYSSFVQELVKAANTPVPAQPAAKSAPAAGAVRGNKPGAPTPDEYANLEKRIQSQMGAK